MEIGIKLLSVKAKKPHKGTSQSLGWDLYSAETKIIEAQSSSIIRTDISIQFPDNIYGEIWGRSGLAKNHGITIGAGLIDTDFTGNIKVCIFNHAKIAYQVQQGDRVAQLVFKQATPVKLRVIGQTRATERGQKGFGSSGIK